MASSLYPSSAMLTTQHLYLFYLLYVGTLWAYSEAAPGGTGVGSGPLPEEANQNSVVFQGPCTMLSNLQDAVLQVMTAHYEYGAGIHHLHGLVSQLQLDLSDLKAQLLELEHRQLEREKEEREREEKEKGNEKGKEEEKGKGVERLPGEKYGEKLNLKEKGKQGVHNSEEDLLRPYEGTTKGHKVEDTAEGHRVGPEGIAKGHKVDPEGNGEDYFTGELESLAKNKHESRRPENLVVDKTDPSHLAVPVSGRTELVPYRKEFLDTLSGYMAGYFNSSLYRESYSTFSGLVHNVTEQLAHQGGRADNLQRRLHGLRKQLKQANNRMADWDKTLKLYDSRMISHMLDKQREINTALERRVSLLEETVEVQGAHLRDQPKLTPLGGQCPEDFVRYASSCYLFGNLTAHWVDAEKHCQSRHANAHLVAIETESEHNFIVMYRQYNSALWSSYYVWTGGTNMLEGGGWRWVSSQRPLGYTRWRSGKPAARGRDEQHCLYFPTVGGDSQWDDWHCYAARLNFVCEITV